MTYSIRNTSFWLETPLEQRTAEYIEETLVRTRTCG